MPACAAVYSREHKTLQADTGARIVSYDAFQYKVPGKIDSITPPHGMKGTSITIRGTNLLGYGAELKSVNLVNTEVAKIVSQNDSTVCMGNYCSATCVILASR